MILLDKFYSIQQQTENESDVEYIITLNSEHFIYEAHFPGHPITPGVCIIQICKELMELHSKKMLLIQKIHNVKFLSIIDPVVTVTIKVSFSKIIDIEGGYKCSALVHWEDVQYAKLNLSLQCQ